MTAARTVWASEILRVWFHDLSSNDWYDASDDTDAMLARYFAGTLQKLRNRPPGDFLRSPQIALAAIVLFDQIPRNLHRGSSRAYEYDYLARAITHGLIDRGWLAKFDRHERQFALMPLMHSENIFDQRLSLAFFARFVPSALPFARSHWRMIARFGRFPHRNSALGRTTSKVEQRAIDAGFSW